MDFVKPLEWVNLMTKRNWKTTLAYLAIAITPLLALIPVATVWAQPPSGESAIVGSPVTQPTPTPTATPQSSARSMAPMAATTLTRRYTRDPVIQVGEIQVENNRTTLAPGESVRLWIDTPSDYDSWTTTDGQSGQEVDDTLFGKWSNGASGYSIVWTAPERQGEYRPKITVNDDITRGSTNGRNDLLVEKSVTLNVVRTEITATITQSEATPNPAAVGEAFRIQLNARLNLPLGTTLTSGPTWAWDFGTVEYRATQNDSWAAITTGFEDSISQSPSGSSQAFYWCTLSSAGEYRIQLKAKATYELNGETYEKEAEAYVG